MISYIYYIILIVSVLLFASVLTLGLYTLLSKLAKVDAPNERSNHTQPVPTGVGLGFMTAVLGFLTVANAPGPIIVGALALMVISFIDDLYRLDVMKRFGFQLIAVILAINSIDGLLFQGLFPEWLDKAVMAVLWLWLINLTNFMDGIDEMTLTQGGSMMTGILLLGVVTTTIPHALVVDAVIILVGLMAFYPWNKHPARCFMGDAGSVPLGFLFGYVLFSLAAHGMWIVALILPAYYLTDATITLMLRALRGEKIWHAHSKHFYQQAVRSGMSHSKVSRCVLGLNAVLIALVFVSLHSPIAGFIALGAAYALSLLLCLYFARGSQRLTHEAAA